MSNKIINRGKLFLVLSLAVFFLFGAINFAKKDVLAAESDAVAVRVLPNPHHYSPLAWYQDKKFSGTPTPLKVDGYEAIQDGRTVYVNVANVVGGAVYTNIYLISYNQNATPETISIFNRVLEKWKFNTNLTETGTCFYQANTTQVCRRDTDCTGSGFCSSLKARITRDTKRLADILDFRLQLEKYNEQQGHFPLLSAGTYVTGKTISVWPSWSGELAAELGWSLPVDPINKLGDCGGPQYDPVTCWDDKTKSFAGPFPTPDGLPPNSRIYIYSTDVIGKNYTACAEMESGLLIGDDDGACLGSYSDIPAPTISCGSLIGVQGQPFAGYITVTGAQEGPMLILITGLPSFFSLVTDSSGAIISKATIVSSDPATGVYPITIRVENKTGSVATKDCSINISGNASIIYPVANQKVHTNKQLNFSVYGYTSTKNYDGISFSFVNVYTAPFSLSCASITPLKDGRVRCDVNFSYNEAYNGDITVSASVGGNDFTSQTFNLDIYNNPPIMKSVTCPENIRVGQPLLSCVAEAIDPDSDNIGSIDASGLPNNIYLTSFSTDKTCEIYFEKIINAIVKKRYEQNKVLGDLTGYFCSDCACREGTPYYDPAACTAHKASNMAVFGFTPADFGGNSFVFDENEHEGSLSNCSYQDYVSLGGCGGVPVPFYACANPSLASASGNRGTLQGSTNIPGTYPITFTATDEFGLTSNPLIFSLKVSDFCGDGVKQSPNTEGKGGNDGYEKCDCGIKGGNENYLNPEGKIDFERCAAANCLGGVCADYEHTTTGVPMPSQATVQWQYGCKPDCTSASDGFCGDALVQSGSYNLFKATLGKQTLLGGEVSVHDKNNVNYGEQCDFGRDINCCASCRWTTTPPDPQNYVDLSADIFLSNGDESAPIAIPESRGIVGGTFDTALWPYPGNSNPDAGPAIVFITDISGNMFDPTLNATKTAIRQSVQTLYDTANEKNGNIHAGAITTYSGGVHKEIPIANLRGNVTQYNDLLTARPESISTYTTMGDSPVYAQAFDRATAMINSYGTAAVDGEKYIIILTDGYPPNSTASNNAKAAGIKIYNVAFNAWYPAWPTCAGTSCVCLRSMCDWSSDNGNISTCYQNVYDDAYRGFCYMIKGLDPLNPPPESDVIAQINIVYATIIESITARIPKDIYYTINGITTRLDVETGAPFTLPLVSCDVSGGGCTPNTFTLAASFTGAGKVEFKNFKLSTLPPCAQ